MVKHGKSVAISLGRRLMIEHCYFSGATQKGVLKRRISIGPLLVALSSAKAAGKKPILPLIFIKAFAIVAQEMPALRRSYVKAPWPQFYEHAASTALMPITRDVDGEETIMMGQFHDPAETSLAALNETTQYLKTAPISSIRSFERALEVARLPFPLRRIAFWIGLNFGRQRRRHFGSFSVSPLGLNEPVYAVHPFTSLLTYGVIDMTAAQIDITLSFDHRVYDGMTAARALEAIERALNGPISVELDGN